MIQHLFLFYKNTASVCKGTIWNAKKEAIHKIGSPPPPLLKPGITKIHVWNRGEGSMCSSLVIFCCHSLCLGLTILQGPASSSTTQRLTEFG